MKKTVQNHGSKKITLNYFKVIVIYIVLLVAGGMVPVFAQSVATENVKPGIRNSKDPLPGVGMDYPLPVRLPDFINTVHEEIRPTISADGGTLYFSRQHYPFNLPGILSYEDIWYSTFNETTRTWSEPENIGPPVKNYGPNSVTYICLKGDTIILANEYRENRELRQGISMSVKEGNDWSFLQAMSPAGNGNILASGEDFINNNNKVILSSMKNADSFGKYDIYVTLLNPDSISVTLNLGHTVNTTEDESAPFLAADNKTLYFASRGHGGYGGYDIFVTQRLDDTWQNWSEPENLGPYVNSSMDEEYYNFKPDGQYAYFTRQVSCKNSDIFQLAIPSKQQASLNCR